MKICTKCEEPKDINLFNKHKETKDGLRPHCKKCESDLSKIYRLKNKEKLSQSAKMYYSNNSEIIKRKTNEHYHNNIDKIKVSRKIYRESNVEKLREVGRIYSLENKHKIKEYRRANATQIKETTRIYHKNNIDLINSITAKRRAAKLQATPKWLTMEQLTQIRLFYREAKELEKLDGIKRHVDHIIPLQGEKVRGLHVPWNLQILTAAENISKKNKIIHEYTEEVDKGV